MFFEKQIEIYAIFKTCDYFYCLGTLTAVEQGLTAIKFTYKVLMDLGLVMLF